MPKTIIEAKRGEGFKPECPACCERRVHSEEEWKFHPYRGHGFAPEIGWTHPDLDPAKKRVKTAVSA
jgi:hypothetical protein